MASLIVAVNRANLDEVFGNSEVGRAFLETRVQAGKVEDTILGVRLEEHSDVSFLLACPYKLQELRESNN